MTDQDRIADILDELDRRIEAIGAGPAYREIAEALNRAEQHHAAAEARIAAALAIEPKLRELAQRVEDSLGLPFGGAPLEDQIGELADSLRQALDGLRVKA